MRQEDVKVGQAVKVVIENTMKELIGKTGKIVQIAFGGIVVEFDNYTNPKLHSGAGLGKDHSCRWLYSDDVELIEEPTNTVQEIVITTDGKTTKLKYTNGTEVISTQSKCHPDDTFDFIEGAILSMSRLEEKVRRKEEAGIPIEPEIEKVIRETTDEPIQVGDRVRFKTWEEMVEEYGTDSDGDIKCHSCFVEEMKHLCGSEATVTLVGTNKIIQLDEFEVTEGDLQWDFSVEMVRKLK